MTPEHGRMVLVSPGASPGRARSGCRLLGPCAMLAAVLGAGCGTGDEGAAQGRGTGAGAAGASSIGRPVRGRPEPVPERPGSAPNAGSARAPGGRAAERANGRAGRRAGADAAPRRVTVAAVGDVLFGRYAEDKSYWPVPVDPAAADPFADVAPVLRRADLALANMESPVLVEPAAFLVFGRLTFRAEPASLGVMTAAGFDVLSFANNHALNFGVAGVRETLQHVAATELVALGVGLEQAHADAPAIFDIEAGGSGRVRVAVLGRTTWLNGRRPPAHTVAIAYVGNDDITARSVAAIRDVRRQHRPDFVIVFLHWGKEHAPRSRKSQQRAARAMIEAGADLVLGHHSHTVQDMERYRGGVIAYSLGNFLFDNSRLDQRRSVIFEAALEVQGGQRRVAGVTLHPVLIDRETRIPRLARGRDYRAWQRALAALAPELDIAPEPPPAP